MYCHGPHKKIIFIVLFCVSTNLFSLNLDEQEKYPMVMLKEDYGILSTNDLAAYIREVKPAIFSGKIGMNYYYWQCFPRENVSITLRDMGHSSEDIGNIENYGDLLINAWSGDGVSNEYSMRRPWAIDEEEKVFHRWQRLMKNEKYVCLAGSVGQTDKKIKNNKLYIKYSWVFEKIKTKKGCYSYFEKRCNHAEP